MAFSLKLVNGNIFSIPHDSKAKDSYTYSSADQLAHFTEEDEELLDDELGSCMPGLPSATDAISLCAPIQGFTCFGRDFAFQPTFRSLTLTYTGVNSDWAVVNLLEWPARIRELELVDCGLTSGDMDAMIGRYPRHLRLPNLDANPDLDDDEVEWVAALPASLNMLKLMGTNIGRETVAAVLAQQLRRQLQVP
ncbi:hypothetical protein GGF32_009711 [Allomyces javanicus]|nr:hypothetical protein GGF32_009711 [Allomyces javanicus]